MNVFCMRENRMPSKITVSRIINDCDDKSVQIAVFDDNDCLEEYRSWLNEELAPKSERKSVVVRLLWGGTDHSMLNLDLCAKRLRRTEQEPQENNNYDFNQYFSKNKNIHQNRSNQTDSYYSNLSANNEAYEPLYSGNLSYNKENEVDPNPLDYYIDKIVENNKDILRNIQTLSLLIESTKKEEMQDGLAKPANTSRDERDQSAENATGESHTGYMNLWACTGCEQVWLRRDMFRKHINTCTLANETDVIREISIRTILQCEFCEQVYTGWNGLTSHQATHTSSKNYECVKCNVHFPSYHGLELHRTVCVWYHNYRDTLFRLFVCNMCDARFADYTQLYNHRYASGHLFAKRHHQHDGSETAVYQCEQCGETFITDSDVFSHRQHFHSYMLNY